MTQNAHMSIIPKKGSIERLREDLNLKSYNELADKLNIAMNTLLAAKAGKPVSSRTVANICTVARRGFDEMFTISLYPGEEV